MRLISVVLLFLALPAFAQEQTAPSTPGSYDEAKRLFDDGKYEEAIAKLDLMIEQTPDSKNAFLLRGTSYDYIGQYDKALEDYTRAIELDPEFVAAYNNRGSVYITTEQYEKGLPDLNRALELNPKNANSYFNRAIINTHLAKSNEVISDAYTYLDVQGCKDQRGKNIILLAVFSFRELGKFEQADNFVKQVYGQCDRANWPYPVLQYIVGEITAEELRSLAKNEQQKADAETFIAYNHYQDPGGRNEETIKKLEWVVSLNYRDSISYILAKKLLHTFEPLFPRDSQS